MSIALAGFALSQQPLNSTDAQPRPVPTYGTPAPVLDKVAFIGDSYTAGTGATAPTLRWASLVSKELNWNEENFGKGGTGYISVSEQCGGPCANYLDTIAEVAAESPDMVIVTGVRNDASIPAAQLDPAIRNFYSALRASMPDTPVYAVSPIWDDAVAPARVGEIGDVIRESVESIGGAYLDIGQPLEGRGDYVVADGVHPSDAGYAAIAASFVAAFPQR